MLIIPKALALGESSPRGQSTARDRRRRLAFILVLAALGAGVSCSSVRIQSQVNTQYRLDAPLQRIAVIAMEERRPVRETFEIQLVRRLGDHHIQAAVTATNLALSELQGTREVIRQRLAARNADAVLITRLADKASRATGPQVDRFDFWTTGLSWLDVDNARLAFYGSGGDIQTTLRLESRLYRLTDGALIWVAHTGTRLKEETDRLERIRTLAKTIVRRMAKDGVIP